MPKTFKGLQLFSPNKITPTIPTVRVIYAIISMVKMIGINLKLPENWAQIIKLISKKENEIISGIQMLPNHLDILDKHRSEIMKLKQQ